MGSPSTIVGYEKVSTKSFQFSLAVGINLVKSISENVNMATHQAKMVKNIV